VEENEVKITNRFRRMAAMCGLGWALADLLPPKPHFTKMDVIITVLALAIYVMSFFIKESNEVPTQHS
jgi:hypothetical protein